MRKIKNLINKQGKNPIVSLAQLCYAWYNHNNGDLELMRGKFFKEFCSQFNLSDKEQQQAMKYLSQMVGNGYINRLDTKICMTYNDIIEQLSIKKVSKNIEIIDFLKAS